MAAKFALNGKRALVTGAGGGIGASLAVALAKAGCDLTLLDKNEAGLHATMSAVSAAGGSAAPHVVDLTDTAAIKALPDHLLGQDGRLDLLVNNAGVALGGRFEDTDLADFEWVMDINLRAVVHMTHAFLPALRQSTQAQIVNVSSLYGLVAPPGQTAYCASKFGVRGFSESLRHELIGSPIGVTLVHPGGVATGIARNARVSSKIDPADVERGRLAMERVLRLSPDKAAATIMRGIEARAWRVIVGSDAKAAALIQRMAPVGYWPILARMMRRQGMNV